MTHEAEPEGFETLVDIIARLRGPDGCPWDRKQTHLSLKPHLLEESYEVVEAIDQADYPELCEELGDLLMQIVLHAQIASEQGKFGIKDVLARINTKLVYRHPHVFANGRADTPHEVIQHWQNLKQEEREGASILSGLPKGMPALAYSQALQRRTALVGFDWKRIDDVIEKLVEEIKEIAQADDHRQRAMEFGDLLFALVNVARWLDIELEDALRQTNQEFYRRFRYMEEACQQRLIDLGSLSLEQQDELWEEAKLRLRQNGTDTLPGPDTHKGPQETQGLQ